MMIRVDRNEQFPITAMILDECSGEIVSSAVVHYTVLDAGGSTTLSGVFSESDNNPGVYIANISLSDAGIYRTYATCSGYNVGTEDILVNPENIYELTKQNRHYNIGVEEVLRTNPIATASQTARNVPMNQTDYIINRVKLDTASDWSGPTVASGIIYAHYRTITDSLPYKMDGPF
jgi:hypothetical protein